jgi:hypothetical protein
VAALAAGLTCPTGPPVDSKGPAVHDPGRSSARRDGAGDDVDDAGHPLITIGGDQLATAWGGPLQLDLLAVALGLWLLVVQVPSRLQSGTRD